MGGSKRTSGEVPFELRSNSRRRKRSRQPWKETGGQESTWGAGKARRDNHGWGIMNEGHMEENESAEVCRGQVM